MGGILGRIMKFSTVILLSLSLLGLASCVGLPESEADVVASQIKSIEFIRFIPDTADGSVEVSGKTALSFEVSPVEVVEQLMDAEAGYLTVTAEYSETKAFARIKYIPVVSRYFSDGVLTVVIDGDTFPDDFFCGGLSVSLALHFSNGRAEASSGKIPVHYEQGGNTISSFSISDGKITEKGHISGSNIVVCLPPGARLTNLVASFTTDAREVRVNGAVQVSGTTSNDFTQAVTYTVSSRNTSAREYVVRVYSFDLPALLLDTPDSRPISSKEIWIQGSNVSIHNTDRTVDDLGAASVKGRGNTTWGFDKHPYTFSLEKKAKVLGMPKDKKWNLIANFIDRTNIRNAVTLELARRTKSLEWTPRGEFVELVLNGKHQGLYFLCEKVKVSKDRVNITEIAPDVVSGDALTGGYLVELDQNYDEKYRFRLSRTSCPVNLKSPDEDVPDAQIEYITEYLNDIEWQLYHYEPADSEKCKYKDLLDIDTFIDYWFVQEVSGNYECCGPKSVFLYKDVNEKLKAGPVWDFDWGTYMPDKVGEWRAKNRGIWYPRMFRDPVFVSRVKEKWNESKDDFRDITNYVDSLSTVLANSSNADYAMWPLNKVNINGDEKLPYGLAIERMKTYINDRIDWLDASIQAL